MKALLIILLIIAIAVIMPLAISIWIDVIKELKELKNNKEDEQQTIKE
jgi:hypothetical protein